ncbi:helix-turn-helix domain-containing protein [Jannaschia seohaensis]|uniref:DNA binding domain-containing protein, excisionase family n=1 Tax=Jannaschia seohaensis TaxID=475081 RepID=A0A2Y9C0E1_9RHOB|nr:helix-turn-helix domain-containing protein [Jannaschia seohaensis]PWJ19360.1 excisionase family DNA binding protein [Jannaschia seohaensis]SSA46022.1 DNA binding domain-containing protein, excisionase family [Jannaschia seohaensis]
MPKQARLTGIKSLRCYTVDEAAETVGVSVRTVRNWIGAGLEAMDDDRPMLIRGDALQAFIRQHRARRKIKVTMDEFYCLACRAARKPAGGMADCTIREGRAMLTALCTTCETVVNKPVPVGQVPLIARRLELAITRHPTSPAPADHEA